MTYENAIEWLIDNLPMIQFDSYDEWLEASRNELSTPNLFESDKFMAMHRRAWENTIGDITKTREEIEEQEIQERQEAIEQTNITEYNDYNTGQRFEEVTYTRVEPIRVSGLPEFREQEIDTYPTLPKQENISYRQEVKTPELPQEPRQRQEQPQKKQNIISRFFGGIRGLFK